MASMLETFIVHLDQMRSERPAERHIVVFDVNHTIMDVSAMIRTVLSSFDRQHQTRFFASLSAAESAVEGFDIEDLIRRRHLPHGIACEAVAWFNRHVWSYDFVLRAHQPYTRVLEFVRCLQMKPRVRVGFVLPGLYTASSDILAALGELLQLYQVQLSREQLFIVPDKNTVPAPLACESATAFFQNRGLCVDALVCGDQDALAGETRGGVRVFGRPLVEQVRGMAIEPEAIWTPAYDIHALVSRACTAEAVFSDFG